jgi:hypothetical protein
VDARFRVKKLYTESVVKGCMARKKRKVEKKEEFEWIPPEFDEKTFLKKDIEATRALIVTVIMCVVFAVIGYLVGVAVHFALGFVVVFVGIYLLRFVLPLARVNMDNIEKKSMLGNYLLFFFLFLGLWVLFMNPPFTDHTDPSIDSPLIWVQDLDTGEWTLMTQDNRATLIHVGDAVNITAVITDNGDLMTPMIKVYPAGGTGTLMSMTDIGEGVFQYNSTYSTPDTTFQFVIVAEDESGNTSAYEGSFLVNQ